MQNLLLHIISLILVKCNIERLEVVPIFFYKVIFHLLKVIHRREVELNNNSREVVPNESR